MISLPHDKLRAWKKQTSFKTTRVHVVMATKRLSYTFHTSRFRKFFHKVRGGRIRWWFLYVEHMPHHKLNVWKKTNVLKNNRITYAYVNQKVKLHFPFHKVRGDHIRWWFLYSKHMPHDKLNAWKRETSFKNNTTTTYGYVNQKAKLHFLYHNIQKAFPQSQGRPY